MLGRWYNLKEEDIGEMYIDEVLDYCNGAMMFETLASSRATPPMLGDEHSALKYQQGIQGQLLEIWGTMFPFSIAIIIEKERRIEEFKSRSSMYRDLAKRISANAHKRGEA